MGVTGVASRSGRKYGCRGVQIHGGGAGVSGGMGASINAMRLILTTVCLLTFGAPVSAQDCTPQRLKHLSWAPAGQAIWPTPTYWANPELFLAFVPDGEVWRIDAAGIATTDGRALEWMLQIELKAEQMLVPLERPTGLAGGTPVMAMTRPIILMPGERLSARVNAAPLNGQMALIFLGWRYPIACVSRVLGMEPVSVNSSAPPDFSAVITAAQGFAQALQQVR